MKRWAISALIGLASFGLGCLAGWYGREKTEVKFEEVTEAELEAFAKEDMEKRAAEEKKQEEPVPDQLKPKTIQETINTQKTEYWAKWHDEAGKYRSHSELGEGEEPVITEEDVENVNLEEDLVIDDEERLPVVELSDEEEYNEWLAVNEGEYTAVEMTWFAGDNVTLDNDDNTPISNVTRCLGFDPKREFEKMGAGKDDVVTIYRKNNVLKTVFQVTRYPASYGKRVYKEEYGGDDDD